MGEDGVGESGIAGDLAGDPRGEGEGFILGRKFDFGEDEAVVVAVKDIDLPAFFSELADVARFADPVALTEGFKERFGGSEVDRELVFNSAQTTPGGFQGKGCAGIGSPNADLKAIGVDVGLFDRFPGFEAGKRGWIDEEFSFNFSSH